MRLLVVSNRLPINVVLTDGQPRYTQSGGGLVSGLSAYLDSLEVASSGNMEYVWIGWPGITIPDELKSEVELKIHKEFQAHPVFLSEEAMNKFYQGFCNKIIWPLFHYFSSYAEYKSEYWQQYMEVNEQFLAAVLEVYEPGDVIWIHDYHLMLLPSLLRARLPTTPIGFFLHIPFPAYEVFQLMPRDWGEKILEGLLGSAVIGFHTDDYTRHFLECVHKLLGFSAGQGFISGLEHTVQVGTFPMGIDFERFNCPDSPGVKDYRDEQRGILAGVKTVLSIDRLDYTKGIVNRLRGFALFLNDNPEWQGKVVLLLVVVPSRIGIDQYDQLKRQIDETVGEINGRFGNLSWTPIIYQYKFLPLEPLLALYRSSDAALITPLRDGMNLIAKEYVSARRDLTGVLILSQFAGAVKEASQALLINPNHLEEIAASIKQALEMPREEQIRRNRIMQESFRKNNVKEWSGNFIESLLQGKINSPEIPRKSAVRIFPKAGAAGEKPSAGGLSLLKQELCRSYLNSARRVFFLDYDGTLVPYAGEPQKAKPGGMVRKILQALASAPGNDVVLLSGRDKTTLNEWFGDLDIALAAEHGIWLKESKQAVWQLSRPFSQDWKDEMKQLLHSLTEKLPGAFIEEKEFTLAWHYRLADSAQASGFVRKLCLRLQPYLRRRNLNLLLGNKVLEIRPEGMDKGIAACAWLGKKDYDFIFAAGDDQTDEDLFQALPAGSYSVRVGLNQSHARFQVHTHVDILEILERLIKSRPHNSLKDQSG